MYLYLELIRFKAFKLKKLALIKGLIYVNQLLVNMAYMVHYVIRSRKNYLYLNSTSRGYVKTFSFANHVKRLNQLLIKTYLGPHIK